MCDLCFLKKIKKKKKQKKNQQTKTKKKRKDKKNNPLKSRISCISFPVVSLHYNPRHQIAFKKIFFLSHIQAHAHGETHARTHTPS